MEREMMNKVLKGVGAAIIAVALPPMVAVAMLIGFTRDDAIAHGRQAWEEVLS